MFGYNTLRYLNSQRAPRRRVRESREPLNLYVGDESAVVTALIPGAGPEDVDITVEEQVLTIKAKAVETADASQEDTVLLRERKQGDFARNVQLPFRVQADQVQATVKDGVVRVELPRAEADKPRKVKISAA